MPILHVSSFIFFPIHKKTVYRLDIWVLKIGAIISHITHRPYHFLTKTAGLTGIEIFRML